MFGMSMPEMFLILVVALIFIGPKKLPDLAKSLGKGIAEFKKATQEIKQNIDIGDDVKEVTRTIKTASETITKPVQTLIAEGMASVNDDQKTKPATTPSEIKPATTDANRQTTQQERG